MLEWCAPIVDNKHQTGEDLLVERLESQSPIYCRERHKGWIVPARTQ